MTERQKIIAPRQPIAIVRLEDLTESVKISRALLQGGIRTLEFTLTNRHALAVIEQVRAELQGEVLVGAGTVLDAESARASILSGAEFLVTPTYQPDVIACGRRYGVPVACGAFTPTEILAAWQSGADLVKVFPAGPLGPAYIKDVRAPLPDIRLVPTGGVNLDNCAAFLRAGAYTVAMGSSLVDKDMIRQKDWRSLATLARRYVEACSEGMKA